MRLRPLLRGAAQIVVATAIATATPLAPAAAEGPALPGGLVLNFNADLMSDSIDRGITQTAHRPGVASTVELQKDWFYVSTEISSVKPPTSPAAEVGVGAGIRPTIPGLPNLDIDVNVIRYFYPGATPVDASGSGAYTEAEASVLYHLTERFSLGGEVAYSPDWNDSGARSVHTAAHAKIDFRPPAWLPVDSYYFWSKLGRMQFSSVSSALGGYQLPNYTHWVLGLGFKKDSFTLELNHTNTTLSRENCYIHTGDPAASGGGAITDTNPAGLRSTWCGPAFYAKLSFEISSDKK
jgi:uncharacterized protein (TIGR02001 family)